MYFLNLGDNMKICVIGQGYIGFPTSILFASNGCNVVGVDINKDLINEINKGHITIEEVGLQEKFDEVLFEKKYKISGCPENADVFIITVPTPYIKDSYECDLTYVISACNSIKPYIEKNNLIIVESTMAPLSMDNIIKPIFENCGFTIGRDLFLVHCPERVLPGNILHELEFNNRIIGGITPQCADKAIEVYSIFVKGEMTKTDAKTAEFSKCVENTFRDVNIAFANEIIKICTELGIDGLEAINMANKHPRVNIHSPGPGVGGHCLAIDPYFIYSKVPEEAKLVKLSRDINVSMPDFVSEKCKEILNNNQNTNNKIAVLGVSYKGNIDDDRESPSYSIINNLKRDYDLFIHDPHINNKSFHSLNESLENASLVLILTDHDEFKSLDYEFLIKQMKVPIIFDTKNIINKNELPSEIIFYNFGNLKIKEDVQNDKL